MYNISILLNPSGQFIFSVSSHFCPKQMVVTRTKTLVKIILRFIDNIKIVSGEIMGSPAIRLFAIIFYPVYTTARFERLKYLITYVKNPFIFRNLSLILLLR